MKLPLYLEATKQTLNGKRHLPLLYRRDDNQIEKDTLVLSFVFAKMARH
jgi:hypothetical protein